MNGTVLCTLRFGRLLQSRQAILATQKDVTLDRVAELGDTTLLSANISKAQAGISQEAAIVMEVRNLFLASRMKFGPSVNILTFNEAVNIAVIINEAIPGLNLAVILQ